MDLLVTRVADPALKRELERMAAAYEDDAAMIDYLSLMADIELPSNAEEEGRLEAPHE